MPTSNTPFIPTSEDLRSLLLALRELGKKHPGTCRFGTDPTGALATDAGIERALSYFADLDEFDYRIDGGQIKLGGSRKSDGSTWLFVTTSPDLEPFYRDFIKAATSLLIERGFRKN